DAGSVRALRLALMDRRELVRAFALRGLVHRTDDMLLGWGSKALFEALASNLKGSSEPYVGRTSRAILAKLAGEGPGVEAGPWREWWRDSGEQKALEAAAKLKANPPKLPEATGGDVKTRARDVTTYWTQTRESGLDVAICLDVTPSMDKTLERVQTQV